MPVILSKLCIIWFFLSIPEKAESAAIIYKKWKAADTDNRCIKMKSEWKKEQD